MRALLLLVALGLLALPGCRDWNEKELKFADYDAFEASDLGLRGLLPRDLVPSSARNLVYVYNMDTTEVRIDFDFRPRDEVIVLAPFLSQDMLTKETLSADGSLPKAPASERRMEVRCAERAVEFLLITDHKHARYWTSTDPKVRADACKPTPPKVYDTPTQAA